jgi:hypothetical protein
MRQALFASGGCDSVVDKAAGACMLLLYPPDTIGGSWAKRTQPAKQRAPKNSLFPLLCIIFSSGKYFGSFILE